MSEGVEISGVTFSKAEITAPFIIVVRDPSNPRVDAAHLEVVTTVRGTFMRPGALAAWGRSQGIRKNTELFAVMAHRELAP